MLSGDVIIKDYEEALSQAGVDMTVEEYFELRAAGGDDFEEVVGEIGEYVGQYVAQNPVGTGYFELEQRTHGEKTTLARYDGYWGEAAKSPGVVFKVVSEPSA